MRQTVLRLLIIFTYSSIIPSFAQAQQWIGAISKAEAHIPDGSYSNAVFKKDTFKAKWNAVNALSARSIILRKSFNCKGHIDSAKMKICGLGHYCLNINNKDFFKAGNRETSTSSNHDIVFAPLWSDYNKTVYYNEYDITRWLKNGSNSLDILLGNGFYNVQRGKRYSKLQASFGAPKLWLSMVIFYRNGEKDTIISDSSWQYALSPITFNSIYGGESYDARMEQTEKWEPVKIVEAPKGTLTKQTAPPVCIMTDFEADCLSCKKLHDSSLVFDIKQEIAGFPEIAMSGKRGQTVKIYVSERLDETGACDQKQTGRPHYYEYTLKGNGIETWHPQFSYYGFRYIQVFGAVTKNQENPNGLPVINKLQGDFIQAYTPETSTFVSNDTLFNNIHKLITLAERSNMQAILTDCPTREKLGWLEQDHLCGPSLLFNYDMRTYIPKIIRDITDTQKSNGMVPTTAPQYVSFGDLFDDSPEWGSTLVVLPFMYYDRYNDSTLITDNYEPMHKYVDYLTSRADSCILSFGLGDWYDYGPWRAGFARNTPTPLVATAYYIYDLQLITKAAKMVGNVPDAAKYSLLRDKVIAAFNNKFYHPDSCYYGTGSQTSNALPLYLDICGNDKQAVLDNLIADIHTHEDRLTTGDIGTRYLIQVLAQNGHNDLVYKMFHHYNAPGYGFQMMMGATTLTEQWDPRNGSSWNHFMLGHLDEWFFHDLSGIQNQPGTHGFNHLIIRPYFTGKINNIHTEFDNASGHCSVISNLQKIEVSLPKGTNAFIILPSGETKQVNSGKHCIEIK